MRARRAVEVIDRHLTVLQLVAGGEGLARLSDGRVAFVPDSAPGDEIEPIDIAEHQGFVRAKRWRLLQAGPGRITPPCPIIGQCGGCDWMHLSRQEELAAKALVVSECLRRIGKIAPPPVVVVAAGPDTGYRSRARFQIDESGVIGFHGRGSHDVVDVAGCLVCHPDVEAAFRRLQRCSRDGLSAFSSVEVRRAPAGARLVATFQPRSREPLSEPARRLLNELQSELAVHVAGDNPVDSAWQRFPLTGGVELLASPECFTQVNLDVNEQLVAFVLEGARRRAVTTFCDLFAGAGNFTLPLLASGAAGVAVERNSAAVAAARRAARVYDFPETSFVRGDVPDMIRAFAREKRRFDLIVLDPPRSGAPKLAPLLAQLMAKYVFYCGCDAPTFARDVSALVRLGYELEEVRAFDMFPRTHHIEATAWLRRAPREIP